MILGRGQILKALSYLGMGVQVELPVDHKVLLISVPGGGVALLEGTGFVESGQEALPAVEAGAVAGQDLLFQAFDATE